MIKFRYSESIFFGIYSNFTFDSETNDIVKLYYDSLKLDLSLDSNFFFNEIVNLFSVDIFYYFCDDITPKIKRLNQYIKSLQFILLFSNNRDY